MAIERAEVKMPDIEIKSPEADNYDNITLDSCDEDWLHEFECESSDDELPRNTIMEAEDEDREDSVVLQMMNRSSIQDNNDRLTTLSTPQF